MTNWLVATVRHDPEFRRRALGKLITILVVWAALTFGALYALATGYATVATYMICGTIVAIPGGILNAILELYREWHDLELTPERNLLELSPIIVSFAVAVFVYLYLSI